MTTDKRPSEVWDYDFHVYGHENIVSTENDENFLEHICFKGEKKRFWDKENMLKCFLEVVPIIQKYQLASYNNHLTTTANIDPLNEVQLEE